MRKAAALILVLFFCVSCRQSAKIDPGRDLLRVTGVYAARTGEIKIEVTPPMHSFIITRSPEWETAPVRSAAGFYTDSEVEKGISYTYTLESGGITQYITVHK